MGSHAVWVTAARPHESTSDRGNLHGLSPV